MLSPARPPSAEKRRDRSPGGTAISRVASTRSTSPGRSTSPLGAGVARRGFDVNSLEVMEQILKSPLTNLTTNRSSFLMSFFSQAVLRQKIEQHTVGGNGQMLLVMKLFGGGCGASGEITRKMFKDTLSRLMNTTITDAESRALFDKIDDDGGGTLDAGEIANHLLPGPGPGSVMAGKGDPPRKMAERGLPSPSVRKSGSSKHISAAWASP